MRPFKVYLNGKKPCLPGLPGDCVLTAIIDHVSNKGSETTLRVGGLSVATDKHVRWRTCRLRVGDDVRVKVVESESADPPQKRYRRDPAKELQSQKRYVREMAAKFGWKNQMGKKLNGPR